MASFICYTPSKSGRSLCPILYYTLFCWMSCERPLKHHDRGCRSPTQTGPQLNMTHCFVTGIYMEGLVFWRRVFWSMGRKFVEKRFVFVCGLVTGMGLYGVRIRQHRNKLCNILRRVAKDFDWLRSSLEMLNKFCGNFVQQHFRINPLDA